VLWSAPDAPELPDQFHMVALGWALHDGERRPMVFDDGPRVAVGDRYVAPLVRTDGGRTEPWVPLAVGAQMPLDRNELAGNEDWTNAARRRLAGRSISELQTALAQQDPDPLAAKHRDLPPDERALVVARERAADSTP
jgi:hypothetical protein